MRGRRAARLLVTACAGRRASRSRSSSFASILDPARDARVGGAAVRRVVLEAAVLGRIVRRRDHDAVGETALAAAVVRRGSRARSPASACSRRRSTIITSTPLAASTSRALRVRGLRQRVGVDAEEQRTVDALRLPVAADRLGDGEDVRLVERARRRRAAMSRRAEGDPLRGVGRVRMKLVVGGEKAVHVDQHRRVRTRAGVWTGHRHGSSSWCRGRPTRKPPKAAALRDGSDGTRTRDLRRDRPAL